MARKQEEQQPRPELLVRYLKKMTLFHGLPDEDLLHLAHAARARWYRRRDLIFVPHKHEPAIFVIAVGSAHLFRQALTGQEVTVAHFHGVDICGLPFLDPRVCPKSFLRASDTPTLAIRIPPDPVRKLIERHPWLHGRVQDLLAARLVAQIDLREEQASELVEERLAHDLVREARSTGARTVVATNTELASMVGASQEEVNRKLHQLEKLGLIALKPRSHAVEILDIGRLERFPED